MDMLQGHQLLNGQRQVFAAQEALDEVDIICYYFSAHWCPPCRQFTPVLADFYKDLKEAGARVEVIFVSSDRSEQDMLQYMAESHGDWLAVPWGTQLVANLKSKYGVSGIPKLVVVKKNGVVITGDGRSDVMRGPGIYNQWASR